MGIISSNTGYLQTFFKTSIIGGAEDKKARKTSTHEEVLDCFLKLTAIEKPIVEVITTAGSEETDLTFKEYQEAFIKLGAGEVNHIHHNNREEISKKSLEKRITKANVLFFSGGDQLLLTSIYGGTDFMYMVKERYIHNHLVIGGTSAGAMALSTPMIYQGNGRDEMIAGNVKVTTGLEFIRDVCIDTHFVHRGRFVRMAQVIATNPSCIGIGIEEDTAIIIEEGTTARVTGFGVVIVIDGRFSKGTNIADPQKEELFTIKGLHVDILSEGETFKIPQMNPPHQ